MRHVPPTAILVCCVLCGSCARRPAEPQLDMKALDTLIEYHAEWNHLTVEDGVREKIVAAVDDSGDADLLYFHLNDDFSLQLRRQEDSNTWTPEGFLRLTLPDRDDYANDDAGYMAARCDYFASRWVLANNGLPYFYCPAAPPVLQDDGVWHAETGDAVVAGPGLAIKLDAEGGLLATEKIFNAD